MPKNDVVLLDSVLAEQRNEYGSSLSNAKYFELFTADQVLRDYDLSYTELEQGVVGGGGDGGLDSMYTFVNGELISEDFDFAAVKRAATIEFWVIQSKETSGFGETALDRATNTFADIADLTKSFDDLVELYDENMARRADCFRQALVQLAARHPQIVVHYVYATKGDLGDIRRPVRSRAESLKTAIERDIRHAEVSVDFIGASELLDFARAPRSYSVDIVFAEQFVSTARTNYVGLVRLDEFVRAVSVPDGTSLNRVLFDSNVRDFHGSVEVNEDIVASLKSDDDGLDFWWLNNGITILGSEATSAGKSVTVRDAQIINGLQTTHSIHQVASQSSGHVEGSNRHVLVKIVVTEDDGARDRIIKATNFQTPVPVASLRATDRLQRNIEDFLKENGWYYDRRKNFYKNLGRAREQIISIPYLAQSLMSIPLKQPDQARARPSTLIKDEVRYEALFSPDRPLEEYLYCVRTQRAVDAFLAARPQEYSPARRANIHFHVAMVATGVATNTWPYFPDGFAKIADHVVNEVEIETAAHFVSAQLAAFVDNTGWTEDRACKSSDFVAALLAAPIADSASGVTANASA